MNINPIYYVEKLSGEQVSLCIQCGVCSASCVFIDYMNVTPRQIMRLLQDGQLEEIMRSNTMWFCVACHTCAERCPKGINIAKVMEAVRRLLMDVKVMVEPPELPREVREKLPTSVVVGCSMRLSSSYKQDFENALSYLPLTKIIDVLQKPPLSVAILLARWQLALIKPS